MNNIENSIRHLQSSIKKRSSYIDSLTDEQIVLRNINTIFSKVSNADKNYKLYVKKSIRELRKEISDSSKQQKIEKKMLAMMIVLNHHKKNQWYRPAIQLANELDNL